MIPEHDDNLQKYLIPLSGLLIRHPRTMTALPASGALCEWTGPDGRYWRRRVKDGSCVIAPYPETADAPPVEQLGARRKGREGG